MIDTKKEPSQVGDTEQIRRIERKTLKFRHEAALERRKRVELEQKEARRESERRGWRLVSRSERRSIDQELGQLRRECAQADLALAELEHQEELAKLEQAKLLVEAGMSGARVDRLNHRAKVLELTLVRAKHRHLRDLLALKRHRADHRKRYAVTAERLAIN